MQFWAHAAVPVGPWQDPCRLLTLLHVSDLPPNANMTWKNIISKQQRPQNRAFFTAFYRKMQFWADATALPFWAPLALMQRPLWTPNRTSLGQWSSNLLLVYHQMQKSPQNHPIKETILEKGIWYNFQPKTIFGNQGSLQQPLCGLEQSFLFFWPLYISLVYYTIWIWSQKTSNHEYRSLWKRHFA